MRSARAARRCGPGRVRAVKLRVSGCPARRAVALLIGVTAATDEVAMGAPGSISRGFPAGMQAEIRGVEKRPMLTRLLRQ